MSKISENKRKKANSIYNQCVIYALIAGALSVPFIISDVKPKLPKKSTAQAQKQPDNLSSSILIPAKTTALQIIHGAAGILMLAKSTHAGAGPLAARKKGPAQGSAAIKFKAPPVAAIAPLSKPTAMPIKPPSKQQISIRDTKIDSKFIDKMEGVILKGYVPLPKTTKSGVTIASGFDLGQMHLKEFNQLPINNALKAKLRPYVGLQRFRAVAFLKSHPLTINATELQELNQIAANKILLPLVKTYDKASKVPFLNLPASAQTALFSFAYQYGPGFMHKSSTSPLWHYYVKQDWSKVNQTLRGYKKYSPRRHQEASLINKLV